MKDLPIPYARWITGYMMVLAYSAGARGCYNLETISALLAVFEGIPPLPVVSPHNRPVMLMFSKCFNLNNSVKNRPVIGDLSRLKILTSGFQYVTGWNIPLLCWNHARYGLSQWGTTLHCNGVSRRLSPYPEISLLSLDTKNIHHCCA